LGEANRSPGQDYPNLSKDSNLSDQADDSPPEKITARISTEGATSSRAVPDCEASAWISTEGATPGRLAAEACKLFPDVSLEDVSAAVHGLRTDESKILHPAAFVRSRKDKISAALAGITASRETAQRAQDTEAQRDRARFEQWKAEHADEVARFRAAHGDCPDCMIAGRNSVWLWQRLETCWQHRPRPAVAGYRAPWDTGADVPVAAPHELTPDDLDCIIGAGIDFVGPPV
jgi:hypothetical protein